MPLRTEIEVAIDALEVFEAESLAGTKPVIQQRRMTELAARLDLDRYIAEGGLSGEAWRTFLDAYLDNATRLRHGRYMAHQVAIPESLAAAGALIDAFTNNAMAIYEMGPSAATVEFTVVNWMLGKIGWRPSPWPGQAQSGGHGAGVLTHGGSLANLTAFAAARARIAPQAWKEGAPKNLVIVAPAGCHYSIMRAAAILGLGADAVRDAPVDDVGRIMPERLSAVIDELRNAGKEIMAVVANAGATATGLYDPLRAVGEFCRDRNLWLHVDGAHGASALVSEQRRFLLDGVEHADSLVWDAHKMLRTPTLCAAVLVRDAATLDSAFEEEASYLFHDKDQPGFDFLHRTVECTKAALGLKVFLALAKEGERGVGAHVERQTELAIKAAALLRQASDFELAVEPESNIVCFRANDDDDLQLEIRRRLTEAGLFYISTTEFRGRRWLRLSLMNPATELADIDALLAEIRRVQTVISGEQTANPTKPRKN